MPSRRTPRAISVGARSKRCNVLIPNQESFTDETWDQLPNSCYLNVEAGQFHEDLRNLEEMMDDCISWATHAAQKTVRGSAGSSGSNHPDHQKQVQDELKKMLRGQDCLNPVQDEERSPGTRLVFDVISEMLPCLVAATLPIMKADYGPWFDALEKCQVIQPAAYFTRDLHIIENRFLRVFEYNKTKNTIDPALILISIEVVVPVGGLSTLDESNQNGGSKHPVFETTVTLEHWNFDAAKWNAPDGEERQIMPMEANLVVKEKIISQFDINEQSSSKQLVTGV